MVTAAAVPTILGATGVANAGLGAASTIMAGRSEAGALEQESRNSLQNARIAEDNANLALVDASTSDIITANRVAEVRSIAPKEQGQVASAVAARGIVSNSGSALQIQAEIELETERQVLQENIIGNRESSALRQEARSLLFESKLYKHQSNLQKTQAKQTRDQALYAGIQGFFAQSSALLPMFARTDTTLGRPTPPGPRPFEMASASPIAAPRPLTTNRTFSNLNVDF
jgi:hypothetical protein